MLLAINASAENAAMPTEKMEKGALPKHIVQEIRSKGDDTIIIIQYEKIYITI